MERKHGKESAVSRAGLRWLLQVGNRARKHGLRSHRLAKQAPHEEAWLRPSNIKGLCHGEGSWLEIGWAPTQTKHKRAWALAGTHDQRIACQHHGSESWTVVSKSRLHRTCLWGVPSCGSLQISNTEVLDCPVQHLGRTWFNCCI